MTTSFILLNPDAAAGAWTGLCSPLDLVLRSLKVRIAVPSHVIVLRAIEANMPGSLMVEAHLVAAHAAHDAWVI
jgi:hypothetical protein